MNPYKTPVIVRNRRTGETRAIPAPKPYRIKRVPARGAAELNLAAIVASGSGAYNPDAPLADRQDATRRYVAAYEGKLHLVATECAFAAPCSVALPEPAEPLAPLFA